MWLHDPRCVHEFSQILERYHRTTVFARFFDKLIRYLTQRENPVVQGEHESCNPMRQSTLVYTIEYPPAKEVLEFDVLDLMRPNEYYLQSGSHTDYALQYPFVAVTKYCADILTNERLERVAEGAHEIAEDFKTDIKNEDGGTRLLSVPRVG